MFFCRFYYIGILFLVFSCTQKKTQKKDFADTYGKKQDEVQQSSQEECRELVKRNEAAVPISRELAQCTVASKKAEFCQVDLGLLRPTQMNVGFEQADIKAAKIRRFLANDPGALKLDKYLRENPEPIVIGPNGGLFIVDHHHLAMALHLELVPRTYGFILENLSDRSEDEFWNIMEACNWVYPFHASGQRIAHFSLLPKHIAEMGDDPYRSVAGFVRKAKGFNKVNKPFAEFRWASYFKDRLKMSEQEVKNNFEVAVEKALEIAQSAPKDKNDPIYSLPGYTGVADEGKIEPAEVSQTQCPFPNTKLPNAPQE